MQLKPVYATSKWQADPTQHVCVVEIPEGTFAERVVRFEGPPQPNKKAAEQAAAKVLTGYKRFVECYVDQVS